MQVRSAEGERMANGKIRVAVNGYGVIGRRVADAVAAQSDMEIVGIADISAHWRTKIAALKHFPVFSASPEAALSMRNEGFKTSGDLDDLLQHAQIVIDCTPKGVGAANVKKYQDAGVKFIVQGGEKHAVTEFSFVAEANYQQALGRQSARVVSCNTTAIVRTLTALKRSGLLKKARGTLL